MSKEIYTDYDFRGVSRVVNLPEPLADDEPVTFAMLKALEDRVEIFDTAAAVEGSIPVYNSGQGKFLSDSTNTKFTITDGGNF
jgi:hypothetical protein